MDWFSVGLKCVREWKSTSSILYNARLFPHHLVDRSCRMSKQLLRPPRCKMFDVKPNKKTQTRPKLQRVWKRGGKKKKKRCGEVSDRRVSFSAINDDERAVPVRHADMSLGSSIASPRPLHHGMKNEDSNKLIQFCVAGS